jgi:myo-inositol-1(or 4)-monophosphatase
MTHASNDTKAEAPEALGDAQLLEIYDFALGLGRRAGKILLDGVDQRCGDEGGRGQNQVDKMNAVDIVTQTDHGW